MSKVEKSTVPRLKEGSQEAIIFSHSKPAHLFVVEGQENISQDQVEFWLEFEHALGAHEQHAEATRTKKARWQ